MANPTQNKPASAYLDTSHTLATGLRCFVAMTEGSGAAVDAVNLCVPHRHEGYIGLGNGDAPVWVANQFAGGPVLRFQAGTPTITYRGHGMKTAWATNGKTMFGVIRHFVPAGTAGGTDPVIYMFGVGPDQYYTSSAFIAKTGALGHGKTTGNLFTTGTSLGTMQLLPNRWYAFAITFDDSTTPDTRKFFLYDYTAQQLHIHSGQGGAVDAGTAGWGETTGSAHFALNNGAAAAHSQFIGDMACAGFAEVAWDATKFQSFYQDPWGVVRGTPAASSGAFSWPTEQVTLTTSGNPGGGTTIWTFYENDGTATDVTLNRDSSTSQTLAAVEAVYGAGNVWVSGLGTLNSFAHTVTFPGGVPPPILKTNSLTGGTSPTVAVSSTYVLPRLWHNDDEEVVITCPKAVGTGTGGSGAPTYQWHRSTTLNFTPDGSTALSGKTNVTLTDTTADADTLYAYRCVATDGSSTLTSDPVIATAAAYPTMRVGLIGTSITNSSPHGQYTKILGRSNARSGIINRAVGGSSWGSRWNPSLSYAGADAAFDLKITNGTASGGTFTLSGIIGGTLANGYTDGTAFGPTTDIAYNASHTTIASALQTAASAALSGATVSGAALASSLGTVTFGGTAAKMHVVLTVDDSLVTGTGMVSGNIAHPIVQCFVRTVGEPTGTTGNAFNLAKEFFIAAGCNMVSIEMMTNDLSLSLANYQNFVNAAVSSLTGSSLKVILQKGTNYWSWPVTTAHLNSLDLQRQYSEWLDTIGDDSTVFIGSDKARLFMAANIDVTSEAVAGGITSTQLVHPNTNHYPMIISQWVTGIEAANGVAATVASANGFQVSFLMGA